jgi:NADPH:quinone reductase-like Zn-dependent oxidoreductase
MTVAGGDTMRAAVIREHGGPEKVRVEQMPRPSVEAPDDVIVRVWRVR